MKLFVFILFNVCIIYARSELQDGPDPWHYTDDEMREDNKNDIPPDIRMSSSLKKPLQRDSASVGDWFFRRMLAIVLKGGQFEKKDDSSIEVSVQMRFEESQWATLNDYLSSKDAMSEEMFRRSVGYIENAIYKPTVTERIVMAWKDYIHFYLVEYKMYITMSLGILAAVGVLVWLWRHMSHKHFKIIIFIALYLYEVFVSYKEADQKEFDRYVSAINACKWQFWSSTCELPPPDPIVFLKYMNPLKIVMRMFTTLISEPWITLSATMQTVIQDITGSMWFPLDKITHGILTLSFNVIILVLLIMILFTYILNIPFNLSFLAGIVSIGVNQGNKTRVLNNNNTATPSIIDSGDRISSTTLHKILDVCSQAMNTQANVSRVLPIKSQQVSQSKKLVKIPRSASTGRLQDLNSFEGLDAPVTEKILRKRTNERPRFGDPGGGDAF